jgi:HSP20 family protein
VALVTRWDPFEELANMHSTMDRLFGRTFQPSDWNRSGGEGGTAVYYLPTDIEDTGSGYRITAPVAGFKPEEVEVTFQNGVLQLTARHAEEHEPESGNFIRRELARGALQRAIQLGNDVVADEIQASVENGMLTVEVPKARSTQPKKITVGSSSQEAKQLQS